MVDSSSGAFTKKADEFRKEAEGKLKVGWFGKLTSNKADREAEAKDLYQQAANCYKAANDRESAIECLQSCCELEPMPLLKAGYLQDSAKIIKSTNSDKYTKFVTQAIEYYTLAGRMTSAAQMSRDAAEKAEEDFNYEAAIKLYEQAANVYEMDNQANYSNQMSVKWADLNIVTVKKLDFAKIIKVYEKNGFKQLQSGQVRGIAKDFFFKSTLCFLANEDLVGCKHAMENYDLEDPTFMNDRKGKFCKNLLVACETLDVDLFAKTVQGYQQITPLDKVCTKLLVKAKMRYCPEKPTAIDDINNEINSVDGDEPAQRKHNSGEDDIDLT